MFAVLSALLFGTAFIASLWTLHVSVQPQLHRYAALFSAMQRKMKRAAPAPASLRTPARASQIRQIKVRQERWAPTYQPALHAAA